MLVDAPHNSWLPRGGPHIPAGGRDTWRRKDHPAEYRPAGIMAGRLSIAVMYAFRCRRRTIDPSDRPCRRGMGWTRRFFGSCSEFSSISSLTPIQESVFGKTPPQKNQSAAAGNLCIYRSDAWSSVTLCDDLREGSSRILQAPAAYTLAQLFVFVDGLIVCRSGVRGAGEHSPLTSAKNYVKMTTIFSFLFCDYNVNLFGTCNIPLERCFQYLSNGILQAPIFQTFQLK
jgi:hypothetical protein